MTGDFDGLASELLNPFGPLHKKETPVSAVAVSNKVSPVQIGELPDAMGVVGCGLMKTCMVSEQPDEADNLKK